MRNHDDLNLWLVSEDERDIMHEVYAPAERHWIEIGVGGIRRRLAPMMYHDQRRMELIHSLLFTLPGTPVLYYGDEIGMADDVSLPDRYGVRTPMQWTNEPNAGFSSAGEIYAPIVNASANVAAQQANAESLLHKVRAMTHARKQLPVLAEGAIDWLTDLPRQALCFWRTASDHTALLALHNLSEKPLTIPVPDGLRDALNPAASVSTNIELPPFGYRWLTK
jgi:maltose alpha-D-glucosyltransferase/alpha-amylase